MHPKIDYQTLNCLSTKSWHEIFNQRKKLFSKINFNPILNYFCQEWHTGWLNIIQALQIVFFGEGKISVDMETV